MQFFDNNEFTHAIYHRFLCLTISKEFAHTQKGEIFVPKYQESEQAHPRRELLEVEQRAHQDKIIQEHGENQFTSQVANKFHQELSKKISNEFSNKEQLFNQVLNLENAASDILEILSIKSASINRITPLIKNLPWLSHELVKLVNKPQYRKRSKVKVTSGNLAVSYIGLENLKMVMPTFILKHWLPESTAPFNAMKRKIWQDSLSIAMASRVLAIHHDVDEYTAFAGGMLSNIGALAITKCFNQMHYELHQLSLKEAHLEGDKRLHDTLSKIETSPELLHELFSKYSSQLSADLVEQMNFDRLLVTEAIFDLAYTEDPKKVSPLAKIILKAKAFIMFRNLAKEELIDADETRTWLAASGISAKEVSILKRADIDHIKLNFD